MFHKLTSIYALKLDNNKFLFKLNVPSEQYFTHFEVNKKMKWTVGGVLMEYWDLYDENRRKLKKIVTRGSILNDNEFHLVVNVWIKNKNNEFLISRRAENKPHPLMWETTGGSVLLGEESVDAAVREAKEELDIDLDKSKGNLIGSVKRYYKGCNDILDVWLFGSNVSLNDIKLQKEEVCDCLWASRKKIRELYNKGEFDANPYFNIVIGLE